MLKRTIFHSLIMIVLLALPLLCFAEYKVVIKKNGKIIEGKLAGEDETSITIINAGARLVYKKDILDLERMKELNAKYKADSDVTAIEFADPEKSETVQQDSPSVADVAKQNRNPQAKISPSDSTEQVLNDWLLTLQERNQVTPSEETEIELSKARKALSHYRSKGTKQLSENDQKLMLEQLVNALDAKYNKELAAGATDDKLAATKRKLEDTKAQLEKLD